MTKSLRATCPVYASASSSLTYHCGWQYSCSVVTILEDIQNAAVDGKTDLATILRKCKLLAVRLDSKPLEDWVIWESNGYPENVGVPTYRIWSLEVLGDFAGPFGSGIKNARIPIGLLTFISEKTKRSYECWECRQSIASIEETLSQSESDRLTVSTGALATVIGTKLYQDGIYNCIHTWGEFGRGHLTEVVNTVRNRILDFALAMEKEAPTAGERQDISTTQTIEPAKVTQIFNTTVYGGAANVVGSANESPISFYIGTKDFSAMEQVLVEKGFTSADIAQLKEALDSDPTPTTPGKFGPKVATWMGGMVEKAAHGGWQIGAGAAGNLLAQLIKTYYGL